MPFCPVKALVAEWTVTLESSDSAKSVAGTIKAAIRGPTKLGVFFVIAETPVAP